MAVGVQLQLQLPQQLQGGNKSSSFCFTAVVRLRISPTASLSLDIAYTPGWTEGGFNRTRVWPVPFT